MYLIVKLDYDDHVIVKLVPLGFDYGTKLNPPLWNGQESAHRKI